MKNQGFWHWILPCLLLAVLSVSQVFAQNNTSQPGNGLKQTTESVFSHLDINYIDAIITSRGASFMNPITFEPGFRFPGPGGKAGIFSNALWIGGLTTNNEIVFAGERYFESDFSSGPYATNFQGDYSLKWEKTWKITRKEIQDHIQNYSRPGYTMPDVIREWPGNGDVSTGQRAILAPFIDRDADGKYSPEKGDYPDIRGDQAVFFMYNDAARPHVFSFSQRMGVEIQGMAYAFNCPVEESFANSIFVHYDIYNRSTETYHNTYLGLETDFEASIDDQDYVQCDVERNAVLVYPPMPQDSSGQQYSASVQSMVILSGPTLDKDQLDNPLKDESGNLVCGFGVNGMNFGDGIPDNERYGLTTFHTYIRQDPWIWNFEPYYRAMVHPVNPDGSHVRYGGTTDGPPCRFMFPGNTDLQHWGTGCIAPNGPKEWTMESAGLDPESIRSLSSMGPFTFRPGDCQELDVVYTATSSVNGNIYHTLNLAKRNASLARVYYDLNETACGGNITSREPADATALLSIFPNPAEDFIRFSTGRKIESAPYRIFNSMGKEITSGVVPMDRMIRVEELTPGYYILEIELQKEQLRCGFIRQ